jgi:hypothetical protein
LLVSKANVMYGPPPSGVIAMTVAMPPVPEPPPSGSSTVYLSLQRTT